jgi:hypothetical protein
MLSVVMLSVFLLSVVAPGLSLVHQKVVFIEISIFLLWKKIYIFYRTDVVLYPKTKTQPYQFRSLVS